MFEELKKEVLKSNLKLYNLNLAIQTWGNVSQKSEDGKYFAIKPSGVPYNKMKISDIVIIDMNGKKVEGKLNPSSDMPTHLVLYKEYKELKGIVHTHSNYGVAFAQAGKDIICFGTTHADNFHGAIPCTRSLNKKEINLQYEYETGKVIIEELKKRNINPYHTPGVLVKRHGPFSYSTKSSNHAVDIAQTMEEIAKMAFHSQVINSEIKEVNKNLRQKHFNRKHGKDAYYGQK